MVYIKHMVMNLGLNTWGFVLYNNLLSLMIAPLFWFLTGENLEVFDALKSGSGSLFDPSALAAVGLSCVFGLAISFFGFAARKQKILIEVDHLRDVPGPYIFRSRVLIKTEWQQRVQCLNWMAHIQLRVILKSF
ncbi:uncharacterized protein DS421_16g568460 [Arachis hypogaea]|nr:uncharacterized protein DS421_16g568460 [Arachis hypogaea]